jgi:hypothetical protein
MEFVSGSDSHNLMKRENLSSKDQRLILAEVAIVLDFILSKVFVY